MKSTYLQYLQDNSWKSEIDEFTDSILNNYSIESGSSNDALETMKLVYKIYFEDIDWRNRFDIKV